VVQLIRAYLGADVFRSGLQLYVKRHAYGNTETTDLWKAWEDASGGKPVLKVMSSWTDQMGFPVLSVSKIQTEGTKFRFKVNQSWFLSDGSRPEGWETKMWSIPILASYESCGSDEVQVVGVDVGLYDVREEKEFVIETNQTISPECVWVKLNAGQHVPMRVLYKDQSDIENLANAVRTKSLQSEDRAGLLLDAYALAKAGLQSPGQILILLRAYENEDNMAVWDAIEQVLGGLSNLLRGEGKMYENFVKFAGNLIKKQAERLGWEEKAGEGHLDNLSRAILVRLQCKYAAPTVADKAKKMFETYLAAPTDPNALNSNIKTPVLRVALYQGGRAEMEACKKTLDVLDTVAEKKDVYSALGFTPKLEDKRAVLDWCTSGAVKLQDFFYPMSSVAGSGQEGAELAFDYMKKNFDRIHAMVKKGSPSLIMAVISYCCSGFATRDRAEEIEQFFKENPVPLANRRVAQIIESTKANAAFLQSIKSDKVFSDMVVS
jgi:puromycin-sensitive aminopeptidase